MENTRKRVAAACRRCRQRKRRCDGRTPACSLCRKSNVDCVYSNPASRRSEQSNNGALQERLGSLENRLQEQARTIETLRESQQHEQQQQPTVSHTALPNSPLLALQDESFQPPHDPPSSHATAALSFDIEAPPMLIPRGHSTTTECLLASRHVSSLLGHFPNGMFLNKELRRGWPVQELFNGSVGSPHALQPISRFDTQHLVEAYFVHAHTEFPVLHPARFQELYDKTIDQGLSFDADSALCLVVLATGAVVVEEPTSLAIFDKQPPGSQYIQDALRILIPHAFYSFGSTVSCSQALLLAAKYFGYLLCPLQSWKLVSMASTSIQHLCSVAFGSQNDIAHTATVSLTAWAVFDTECDLVAEHQLPHSGIEHLMKSMPFPIFDDHSEATVYLLAELSVRKLLNRVHCTLYDNATPTFLPTDTVDSPEDQVFRKHTVSQVLNIARELDYQLESWFELLPSNIRPNLEDPESWRSYELCLLQRYHSAKDVIFRPFLTYVCALPFAQQVPSTLLECCATCIRNCRSYIEVSAKRLQLMCSNREIYMHSILASTLVLTMAARCHFLKNLVRDIDTVQNRAIEIVSVWSVKDSLIEDIADILKLLQTKTRLFRSS